LIQGGTKNNIRNPRINYFRGNRYRNQERLTFDAWHQAVFDWARPNRLRQRSFDVSPFCDVRRREDATERRLRRPCRRDDWHSSHFLSTFFLNWITLNKSFDIWCHMNYVSDRFFHLRAFWQDGNFKLLLGNANYSKRCS